MELCKPLVLASQSPRRRYLLDQAGLSFSVQPSKLHEPDEFPSHVPPAQQAEALAYFKARQVSQSLDGGHLVLGCDTLVAKGNQVFNKAADEAQARQFLRALSGCTHQVYTGIALLDLPARTRTIAHAVTHVTMRTIADDELEAYVRGGQWKDKAGAYAIQEGADAFVERLDGSFTNVVGLPMELLLELLSPFSKAKAAQPC